MFFKSPYYAPGEAPVHDLFKQEKLLLDWARTHANAKPQPYTNGITAHAERTP
jgi:hypothetical protein